MPTTVEKGYGQEHRRLKEFWRPVVDRGEAWCHEVRCINAAGRWIKPGTPWDLAHAGKGVWRGPAHAACNRSEAGRRGNPRGVPKRRLRPWKPTQDW